MKLFSDMKIKMLRFFQNEEGASAIEYAILAGIIAVVLIAVAPKLQGVFEDAFDEVADAVGGYEPGTTAGGE